MKQKPIPCRLRLRRFTVSTVFLFLSAYSLLAQGFNSGSTGAYGPMTITSNTTLNLPPDGIFHCTSITVAPGVILNFNRNALNTPVYLLATTNVLIQGHIYVNGEHGDGLRGGRGGPGGFDGGAPGFDSIPPGAGHGPGAGRAGIGNYQSVSGGGPAAHATAPDVALTNAGSIYGSPLLFPLVGGSGGGGSAGAPGNGGGGGGGALLIASGTRITLTGEGNLQAVGGSGAAGGSGGAFRLVAPRVEGAGTFNVGANSGGGAGRIRIDTIEKDGLQFNFQAAAVSRSVGSFLKIFPNPLPSLDIIEAAGTTVPEGSGPVSVNLPFGSSTNRTVTVQARNFGASVPIRVVLTPQSGSPQTYDAVINNQAANPATNVINVTLPVNTIVNIHAWTR